MKHIYLTIAALFAAATVNVHAQNTANGHEYVDLGLPSGTLWATMNVGSSAPERVGDLFAWGETETKDEFTMDNYKWLENGHYIKYDYIGEDETRLEWADDAARVNWGGSWRMPTESELRELINNCNITTGVQNRAQVFKFTSKINGNVIVFHIDAAELWGSDRALVTALVFYAISTEIVKDDEGFVSSVKVAYHNRFEGRSVRPVISKTATAIKAIDNEQLSINNAAGALRYNLAGQRVGDDYKGIVIVNGKKRVVK